MKKLKRKGVAFWSFVTAASQSILNRCSTETYRKVRLVGGAILFTAFTSGSLMGSSVFYYTGEWQAALLGFIFWFSLLFVLDRMFVSSRRKLTLSVVLIRSIPILASIMLIDAAISTKVFHKTILVELAAQNQVSADSIKEHFTEKIAEIDSLSEVIRHRNVERADELDSLNKLYEAELYGRTSTRTIGDGQVAKALARMIKNKERTNAEEQEADQVHLVALEERRDDIQIQLQDGLSTPLTIDDWGPLERTDVLSKVLFRQGNGHLLVFALGIMIVICIIELIPLIAKHQVNYSELATLSRREIEFNLLEQAKVDELEREFSDKEAHHAMMHKLTELEIEHVHQEKKMAADAIMESYRKKILMIRQLMGETKENGQYAQGEFVHLINQAAMIARQEIEDLFDQ